jgi:hypothetical protein
MKLKDIAEYVTDKISSDAIDLDCFLLETRKDSDECHWS